MSQASKHRKKRSRYEIVLEVLEVCQNGAKKTWVMYRANLSYDLTTNYLSVLMKEGLIENKDGLYYITDKGKELLELLKAWKQRKDEMSELTKKINEILPKDIEVDTKESEPQTTTETVPSPSS